MFRRRRTPGEGAREFSANLLAEARTTPGGWVYEIDPAFAPDGADGAIPPEGIKGGWKIGDDGVPTGEFIANPGYRGRTSGPVAGERG